MLTIKIIIGNPYSSSTQLTAGLYCLHWVAAPLPPLYSLADNKQSPNVVFYTGRILNNDFYSYHITEDLSAIMKPPFFDRFGKKKTLPFHRWSLFALIILTFAYDLLTFFAFDFGVALH
jgi:hypothetical protein